MWLPSYKGRPQRAGSLSQVSGVMPRAAPQEEPDGGQPAWETVSGACVPASGRRGADPSPQSKHYAQGQAWGGAGPHTAQGWGWSGRRLQHLKAPPPPPILLLFLATHSGSITFWKISRLPECEGHFPAALGRAAALVSSHLPSSLWVLCLQCTRAATKGRGACCRACGGSSTERRGKGQGRAATRPSVVATATAKTGAAWPQSETRTIWLIHHRSLPVPRLEGSYGGRWGHTSPGEATQTGPVHGRNLAV